MKIVFFGTAGAIQSKDNANVSFSVVEKKLSILVDSSGNPVQYLNRVGIDPKKLDSLILTHSHIDHIYAVPSLIHNLWLMKRKKPLNISKLKYIHFSIVGYGILRGFRFILKITFSFIFL